MANIQSSINQMISLAGLLASQSPAAKAEAEKRSKMKLLKQEAETLNARDAALRKAYSDFQSAPGTPETGEKEYKEILKERADIAKRQYEINPTEETYAAYAEAEKAMKPDRIVTPADPDEIGMEAYDAAEEQATLDWYANQANRFNTADASVSDAQNRLRETRRRSREVVYGGME